MVEPHKMPPAVQRECGCAIGVDYPAPIVDGAASYRRAVSEFARVRAKADTKADRHAYVARQGHHKVRTQINMKQFCVGLTAT